MKKLYMSPEMEVIEFESRDDVITTSNHEEGDVPFPLSDDYSYETYGLDELTGF